MMESGVKKAETAINENVGNVEEDEVFDDEGDRLAGPEAGIGGNGNSGERASRFGA